ncbi:MAG: diguanylate cyclase [Gemmatimonadaceae bacterium]
MQQQHQSTGRQSRILIVDDHEDNVDLLQTRLEAWGYATEVARDGELALAAVRASPPDLILLDVMMPKIDGIEVARQLKADATLPFIPIIMQTALDSTEHKVEGLSAGADDYITKPIEFAELGARVKSMLRIKQLQDEIEARGRELTVLNDRLRLVNEQLLYTSQTDALTGLDNRRHLEERLQEMYEHAVRMGEPLGCVMCDLDKFKSVNDTYGHQVGDTVLSQLATILKGAAREVDRVGRYGGEEFMILLAGTAGDAAEVFAERVRKDIEAHTFTFEGGSLRRTASFGVAAWPHPLFDNSDALVKAADDALYVAKETGRNRVVGFDTPEFHAHTQADNESTADADVTGRILQPGRGDHGALSEDRGAAAGT